MKVGDLFKATKVDVVNDALTSARKAFGHIKGASDLELVSHSNACLRNVNSDLRAQNKRLEAELRETRKGNKNA